MHHNKSREKKKKKNVRLTSTANTTVSLSDNARRNTDDEDHCREEELNNLDPAMFPIIPRPAIHTPTYAQISGNVAMVTQRVFNYQGKEVA